jgi:uncharacterized membrane protein required for colicin V production
MGLDIVLGLIILAAGVRGWFRGFVIQAIRLAGLVGCVYAAAPIRDYAKPYVATYLASVRPDLLDRLLWWSAAILTYVISVGLASLAVKMVRRRPFGETEPNRTDQFAGFVLGGLKGALIASFLVAGIQRLAVDRLRGIDWVDEQAKGSYALEWDRDYQPARKVWTSVPVQHYVSQIKRMGLTPSTGDGSAQPSNAEPQPVQAATTGSPPRLELELPRLPSVDPSSPDFTSEFDRILKELDARPAKPE